MLFIAPLIRLKSSYPQKLPFWRDRLGCYYGICTTVILEDSWLDNSVIWNAWSGIQFPILPLGTRASLRGLGQVCSA